MSEAGRGRRLVVLRIVLVVAILGVIAGTTTIVRAADGAGVTHTCGGG